MLKNFKEYSVHIAHWLTSKRAHKRRDTYWAWSSWSLAFKSEFDSWVSLLLSWASSVFRASTCCCRSCGQNLHQSLIHHTNGWVQTTAMKHLDEHNIQHTLTSTAFFLSDSLSIADCKLPSTDRIFSSFSWILIQTGSWNIWSLKKLLLPL